MYSLIMFGPAVNPASIQIHQTRNETRKLIGPYTILITHFLGGDSKRISRHGWRDGYGFAQCGLNIRLQFNPRRLPQ